MTPEAIQRYARHLVLKEIGGPGQQSLFGSRVAIVGVGGLGGPAGLYLAAAGVGQLSLIDDDHVDLSNLQRQIQFGDTDIGQSKTGVMANRLKGLNPTIEITQHTTRLMPENATNLLADHDLILDGTDSFDTRFCVNKAALALATPLISGALGRWDGQVCAFTSDEKSPCYQCLVPSTPPDAETCASVGVVGALAGLVGSMMAMEAIKILTGAGKPLLGRLWIYDGLRADSRTVKLQRDPDCPACG